MRYVYVFIKSITATTQLCLVPILSWKQKYTVKLSPKCQLLTKLQL